MSKDKFKQGAIPMDLVRSTKLIELTDGTLIEVEVPGNEAKQIAATNADLVQKSVDLIKPLLTRLAYPVAAAVDEIKPKVSVESAEVEINLGFTAEGNVYITKLQSNSSLRVKLTLKA